MSNSVSAERTLAARLSAFVVERFPFALDLVRETLKACAAQSFAHAQKESDRIEALRAAFVRGLQSRRDAGDVDASELGETTPGVAAKHAAASRRTTSSSTPATASCAAKRSRRRSPRDERREILRGMILTRAIDNRLKQFFTGGEVRYGDTRVPGQGLPIARPGSDLRRRDPPAPRRRRFAAPTARGTATSSRR